MPTNFLTLDEVLAIHRDQIERYGGSPGLLDISLLESALAQPQASFGGELLHADIFDQAAAYLFHIVQNHPFVDGNKRVGAVACLVFLRMNDRDVSMTQQEFETLVLNVAQGNAEKSTIAGFFRSHSIKGENDDK